MALSGPAPRAVFKLPSFPQQLLILTYPQHLGERYRTSGPHVTSFDILLFVLENMGLSIKSDQCLHCLPLGLHFLDALFYSNFRVITAIFSCLRIFRSFTVVVYFYRFEDG